MNRTYSINPHLRKQAAAYIKQLREKIAVQPPMDPSAADGMPPGMDPAAAGGAPPGMDPAAGGMPPGMDPSMMAGGAGASPAPTAPPPDPTGGAGGGANPLDAVLSKLDQLGQQMQMAPQNQQGPGGAPGGPGKPGKPDLLAMSMDIFQLKKIVLDAFNKIFQLLGQEGGYQPPQEVIDGPNRDPSTGMPMPPGMPGSTSDPNMQTQQGQPQGAPGGAGPQSSIKPIQPIQGAMPVGPGGGGTKQSSFNVGEPYLGGMKPIPHPNGPDNILNAGRDIQDRATALATLFRSKKG